MSVDLGTSVRNSVTVELTPERAFALFTDGFDTWWLRGHSIGQTPMQRAVLETRAGGRWYEVDEDGSECDWGRVLVWKPPHRLVLAWQLNAEWAYDPELVTEVEATFTDLGGGRTEVSVEHRNLDRFGPATEQVRIAFTSPSGWPGLLQRYRDAA